MNLQQQLRVLELDLSGSDIKVGAEKLIRYDIARMLNKHGVSLGALPIASYKSGKLQNYIRGHLEQGSNYAVLDFHGVVLDSQLDGVSILSNYYRPHKGKSVYLEITEVAKAKNYSWVTRIGVEGLDKLVRDSGVKYKPLSSRFVEMIDIEDFGRPAPKKPETPIQKVVQEKPAEIKKEVKNAAQNGGWEDVLGKRKPEKFERVDKITSPKLKPVPMEDFPLKRLEEVFVFPRYQRKTPIEHALLMLKAMLKNEFEGAIIKTTQLKNGKYNVEDGKNTLLDLKALRDHFGMEKYNIYNNVYIDRKGNKLFERLNMGKTLNANDKVKLLDDGSLPFFNVLRPHLSYYTDKEKESKMTFSDMGYAHMYFQTQNWHPNTNELRDVISKIPEEEALKMESFLEIFNQSGPGYWIRKPIFRNLYRVFREKKMSQAKLQKTMEIVVKDDKKLFALSRASTKEEFDEAYVLISRYVDKVKT